MEVEDNGIGLEYAKQVAFKRGRRGIGLANLRERYRLLFREDAEIKIIPLTRGTKVKLSFPLLISIPYSLGGLSHVENSNC